MSSDKDAAAFGEYFGSHMAGFFAVSFAESALREEISERYGVECVPHLVVIDAVSGEAMHTRDNMQNFVVQFGASAFPFARATIAALKTAATAELAAFVTTPRRPVP